MFIRICFFMLAHGIFFHTYRHDITLLINKINQIFTIHKYFI